MYPENATNPAAIPERLYLTLGHEAFMRQVLLFGPDPVRQHRFPMRPLGQRDGVLGTLPDPEQLVVHGLVTRGDPPAAQADVALVRAALEARFRLVPAPAGKPPMPTVTWQRWTLAPR